jgi:hypothetical protein
LGMEAPENEYTPHDEAKHVTKTNIKTILTVCNLEYF